MKVGKIMISLFESSEEELALDEAILESETDDFLFANESAEVFNEADEPAKASMWAKLKQWIKEMAAKLKVMLVKVGESFKSATNKAGIMLRKVLGIRRLKDNTVAEAMMLYNEDPVEFRKQEQRQVNHDFVKDSMKEGVKEALHPVKVTWDWLVGRLKSMSKVINKINPFKKNTEKDFIKGDQYVKSEGGKDGKNPAFIKSLITKSMGVLSKAIKAVKNFISNTFKGATALFKKRQSVMKDKKEKAKAEPSNDADARARGRKAAN